MKKHPARPRFTPVVALLLLVLGVVGCENNPVDGLEPTARLDETAVDGDAAPKATESFADAEAFFEFNTTDNDLGLQIFLDAVGWTKVDVTDPNNRKIFQIHTQGPLSNLGITELRFESAEPSPGEVLALFPEGEYAFRAHTADGGRLAGEAELSHVFLDPFAFTPSGGAVVDPNNTTVTWNAPDAELVEIILESDDNDNLFDVIIEDEAGSLDIPPQFLDAGLEYKIELLAYHENGNRTIVESTFNTAP